MIGIKQYQEIIDSVGFKETEILLLAPGLEDPYLFELFSYSELGVEVKAHLAELFLWRNFPITSNGIILSQNPKQLISEFLNDNFEDKVRSWNTGYIEYSVRNILDDNCKAIPQSTLFLYSILEGYSKAILGHHPNDFNHHQKDIEKYPNWGLSKTIESLRKGEYSISKSLNVIDKKIRNTYKKHNLEARNSYYPESLANRLSHYRNALSHGETQSAGPESLFLCLMYILFHFHYDSNLATKA